MGEIGLDCVISGHMANAMAQQIPRSSKIVSIRPKGSEWNTMRL